jgi:hypothetical protein
MIPIGEERPCVHPAAVEALRRLWEDVSEITDIRWAYREAVAVKEDFRPNSIRPLGMEPAPEGYPDYAEDAEPVPGNQRGAWRLLPEIRHEGLQRLATRERMREALAANPVRPDSRVESMLAEVLDGKLIKLKALARDNLSALLIVRRWLEGILPSSELPDADALSAAFARADLLGRCEHLLVDGFVNREEPLQELQTYLWSAAASQTPLLLYGIGGVGKSTLLAKFVVEEIDRHGEQLLIVPLDVDSPAIDPLRPHTFLIDAVSQIVRQRPAASDQGQSAIQALREFGSRFALGRDGISLEAIRSFEHDVMWLQIELVRVFIDFVSYTTGLLPETRLLIIVDTFEEAQVRGAEAVEAVVGMFQRLMAEAPAARVVLSGRIRADEDTTLANQVSEGVPAILLRDLDQRSALDLLKRQIGPVQPPLGREEFKNVLRAVGRNPMCLKLAARVIRNEGGAVLRNEVERESLLNRLGEARVQAFLFGRILDHFQAERIKPLVYPGLIVRRITPDLISEVLAVPCGLQLGPSLTSQQLYEDLERERTIVEPDHLGGLRFRTDLRGEILNDVLRKVPDAVARDIDRRAVAFYARREDPQSRAEEIYHRLRLNESLKTLEPLWKSGVGDYLKGSLAELPTAGRLWLAGKLGFTLDAETRALADQASWEQETYVRAERYLKLALADKALAAIRERTARLPGSRLYGLEVDALRVKGDHAAALATAYRGLQSAAGTDRTDLLLLAASLEEARGELDKALYLVVEADLIARAGTDPMPQLRTLVTQVRLLRKLGRKKVRDKLRKEALSRIDAQMLRNLQRYPRLLEEVAAELGKQNTSILEAAVKRLGVHARSEQQLNALAEALHAGAAIIPQEESTAVDMDLKKFGLNLDAVRNLVEESKGKDLGGVAGGLLRNTFSNGVTSSHITEFFRAGVERGLGNKSDK